MSGLAADWPEACCSRAWAALAIDAVRNAALARMSLIIVRSYAHNIDQAGENYTQSKDFSKDGVVSERAARSSGERAGEPPKIAAEPPFEFSAAESAAD